MAVVAAPYETSITAGFNAMKEWAGFLEKISPAITQWILAKIPLRQQRIIDRRIRKCKRICRKGNYNAVLILMRVTIDFNDLSSDLRSDIVTLLKAELNVKP